MSDVVSDSHRDEASDAMIRSALLRIQDSEDFAGSQRIRRLLDYVVTETLAGRSDRIKAYTLATVVFDRGPDFDPQLDPIVRLEASRLRRALEHYYLTSGKDDPIRISVPKGSYVPVFDLIDSPPLEAPEPVPTEPVLREPASRGPVPTEPVATGTPPTEPDSMPAPAAPRPRRAVLWSVIVAALVLLGIGAALYVRYDPMPTGSGARGPTIFVMPFSSDGAPEPSLAYGLTLGVIADLTRFSDLSVFAAETSYRSRHVRPNERTSALGIDYIVYGHISAGNQRFRSTISLIDARSGRQLWSGQSEGSLSPATIFDQQAEIASQVARSIAQPYGIIFSNRIKEVAGKPPDHLTSYECVLAAQLYVRAQAAREFDGVRTCLQRAIADDPFYAEAIASLSLLHSDVYRIAFGTDRTAQDHRREALALAKQAVQVDPNSSSGFLAQLVVYWQLNNVDRAFDAAEKGLALNPNNTLLLANYGARLCLQGSWEKGLPMLQQAFALNPSLADYFHYVSFLDYYRNGNYQKALAEALEIDPSAGVLTHAFLAMAHSALGHTQQAQESVKSVLAVAPDFPGHAIASMKEANFHPVLIATIAGGLRAAGMDVR